MSSALLFVALLAQFPDAVQQHNARVIAAMERQMAWSMTSDSDAGKQAAQCQAVRFAASFNHLKKTLDDFADAYNQGVLDLKKIEEVKKAWRDLESTEARFRLEKHK